MSPRVDRFTAAVSLALVLGALLACKRKKSEPEPTPSAATAAPAATPAPSASAAAAPAESAPPVEASGPKLGEVTHYPTEERSDEAAVKILEDNVKVFNEADNTKPEVATLPKDLVVVRLSTLEKEQFTLVDFPSGIGQFSPGWVETKFLEAKGAKVARDKVLSQEKKANIAPTTKAPTSSSAKPPTSAVASASAAPAASASAATAAAVKSATAIVSAAKTAVPIDPKAAAAAQQMMQQAQQAAQKATGTGGTATKK